jgi:hypothetical protein
VLPGVGGGLRVVLPLLLDVVIGVVAGAVVLAVVSGAQRVMRPRTAGA